MRRSSGARGFECEIVMTANAGVNASHSETVRRCPALNQREHNGGPSCLTRPLFSSPLFWSSLVLSSIGYRPYAGTTRVRSGRERRSRSIYFPSGNERRQRPLREAVSDELSQQARSSTTTSALSSLEPTSSLMRRIFSTAERRASSHAICSTRFALATVVSSDFSATVCSLVRPKDRTFRSSSPCWGRACRLSQSSLD
jgi:hypothetical protein